MPCSHAGAGAQEVPSGHASTFIYLFMAVLGLRSCAQAFSSCDECGLLSGRGVWASRCGGFFCCRAWALSVGSVVVVPGLSCSKTCGIFPDQGSNFGPLDW